MSEPIKSNRLGQLAGAPTPQNTPATAASSFAQRASQPPRFPAILEEGNTGGKTGKRPSLLNESALVELMKDKLNSLAGKPSGYIDSLPKAVKDRILALKAVQSEHAKIEAEFNKELIELEKKFAKLYAPVYERRFKIVSGQEEATAEEIVLGKTIEEEENPVDDDEDEEEEEGDDDEDEEKSKDKKTEDDEEEDEDEETKNIKGIPEFWLTALKNLPQVSELISERDEFALASLIDMRIKYLENVPGFTIEFEFADNEFFTNKVLTKTYYYQEEIGYGGEFVYDRAEGDEIKWTSPENNLTIVVEKRKQRNKHTQATRTVTKFIPTESFFNFFSPPAMPKVEETEDMDRDELAELEARLEIDFQCAEEIKEKLIPRAIDWYTGIALEYEEPEEYDEEDFEDEDEDDEDDEDDDDDDDDDDEDDEEDGASGQKAQQAPECKQQ